MAAPVVGDARGSPCDARKIICDSQAVRTQRPAMAEGDDWAVPRTPVLVVKLYAILGRYVAVATGLVALRG